MSPKGLWVCPKMNETSEGEPTSDASSRRPDRRGSRAGRRRTSRRAPGEVPSPPQGVDHRPLERLFTAMPWMWLRSHGPSRLDTARRIPLVTALIDFSLCRAS